MTDLNQFGSTTRTADASRCTQCEAMLIDALDGTLTPADQPDFDSHIAGCPSCAAKLASAERGARWLGVLKPHRPEPPADLLTRILSQTSQAPADSFQLSPASVLPAHERTSALPGVPAWKAAPAFTGKGLTFRRRIANLFRSGSLSSFGHIFLQPRLVMTAAMAFFSIGLTLNLTGVRLSDLRASNLRPSTLQRAFYATEARIARTVDNMRVVYELESRVRVILSDFYQYQQQRGTV